MDVREVSPAADDGLAHMLLQVQHGAYTVEAGLIKDDRIPQLHETVEELRAAALLWLAAFIDGQLSGAVAWAEKTDEVDLDRLVVAPAAHRRGIGSALVREVLHRAGPRRTVVSTGRDNTPARRLYERLGFVHVADQEVIPRLWTTRYIHVP